MSKLYWKLRAGGSFKPMRYQTVYLVTRFRTNNKRRPMATYPSNRWGYGYWINKHKRKNNG